MIIITQSGPNQSYQNDFKTWTPNKGDAIELDEGMSKARPVHPRPIGWASGIWTET